MKKPERRVKIAYAFNQISPGELLSIYLGAALVLLLIIPTAVALIVDEKLRVKHLSSLFGYIAMLTIPLGLYVVARFFRMIKGKVPRMIRERGKRVIGTIVSLKTIDLNGANRNKKHFTYTIEDENPEDGKIITTTTPAVLSYRMYLKEEDLPIKVVVYVYGGQAFADEIINPPIIKMSARRFIRYLPIVILAIMFFSSLFIANMDFREKVDTIFYYGSSTSMLLGIAAIVCIFMEAYNPRDPLS